MTPHTTAPNLAASAGEWGRGWPVVLMATGGVATSVSVLLLYSFGALVLPLEQAFGWSRAEIQLAASFIAAGGALSVNAVGWLNARFGARRVSTVSLIALSLGLLGVTQMPGSVGWLYAAYFALPFLGIGTTPVTWTQWVNLWFERHRGLALSLALCGSGLAAALLPQAITWAVGRWDWRAAYVLLAALPLLLTLPWALRQLPAKPTAAAAHAALQAQVSLAGLPFAQVVRGRVFWTCNLALTLVVAAVVGLVTNTVPMLRGLGLSAEAASAVFGVFGLSLVAGRLVVGLLLDRLWAPGVAALTLLMPALGCLIFLQSDAHTPLALLMLATALAGIGSGAEFDIAAYIVARYFGMRDYGKTFGVHLGMATIGSALAPFLLAALLRGGSGYAPVLMACAACCVAGPMLLLTLGRYPHFEATAP